MTDDEQPTTPGVPSDRDPTAPDGVPGPAAMPTVPPPTVPPPMVPPSLSTPAPPPPPPGPPDDFRPVAMRPPRTARRRRKVWVWIWGVLGVLVLAALVASRINLDYYAIQPGTAQSVQPFITVPPAKNHPVTHPVLLTDVREARVNALTYLFFKLEPDTALYSLPSVTGGTPPEELDAQGALQMDQAEAAAKTSALRHLGYSVPATPAGAVIAGTFAGTPAYGVLDVGDVVTALDGTPTLTAEALSQAIAAHHSGETVTFTVRKHGTGAPGPVALTLKRTKVELGGQTVYVTVGIEPQDQVDYTYPFPISINVTDIGGPSAGLAMTLGVIDALSSGSVTGGHTVAATGTMDASGNVGDVGGVPQKTVAVENAGATIFLVPPQEYQAALSKDRPGLKIYAVSTLDQALRVLEANGGRATATTLDAGPSRSAG
jgi:Lon-like protease